MKHQIKMVVEYHLYYHGLVRATFQVASSPFLNRGDDVIGGIIVAVGVTCSGNPNETFGINIFESRVF